MKHLIPKSIKLQVKLMDRYFRQKYIQQYQFAKGTKKEMNYVGNLVVRQEIKKSHLFENKIHNLNLAIDKFKDLVIHPGEVLSFWRIAGRPSAANHYKKGRNIVSGKLVEEYGGGLCQLSGMIFHLALKGGLKILERHSHSLDLYTPETRYTPIGTDATVVYGYKDLLISNNAQGTLKFSFTIKENRELIGQLFFEKTLKEVQLITEVTETKDTRSVVISNRAGEVLLRSSYGILKEENDST